jgi:predicted glycoside hydrolase/deacetylase ChbG (UPF0249 family)
VTAGERYVIVNADDFGLSDGVNAGIIEAHERGIVTSASLMVCQAGAEAAAEYGRRRPALSVGLHVDFGEWAASPGGKWEPVYQPVDMNDAHAVRREFLSQLSRFRALTARNPTHLDSHQHAHRQGAARMVLRAAGARLGLPVRHFSRSVRYCGDFYGQDLDGRPRHEQVTPAAMVRLLSSLPAGAITELTCHAGEDDRLNSTYAAERRMEVVALTDDSVRRAVRELKITLCSFASAPLQRPRRPDAIGPAWVRELKRAFARAAR